LLLGCNTLLMKIQLTSVKEGQRIRFLVELGEVQLLEQRWAVLVVVTVARAS